MGDVKQLDYDFTNLFVWPADIKKRG